ncbi:MAG: hypothetical protein ACR2NV_09965, partial [Thermoleophilaceae bacterium]
MVLARESLERFAASHGLETHGRRPQRPKREGGDSEAEYGVDEDEYRARQEAQRLEIHNEAARERGGRDHRQARRPAASADFNGSRQATADAVQDREKVQQRAENGEPDPPSEEKCRNRGPRSGGEPGAAFEQSCHQAEAETKGQERLSEPDEPTGGR